ncbi:hypothetical protein B0A48_03785 [Cryoendolithus antarcticus]|uniref:Methyltransferase domain-containing protein n=1 Tax=Cryoendolithus antarcticus TaxID=1507870 RepID=A0A1V8TGV5_9PEZI|nr:hypothetical protein B0A48_03785 [Cryoendolithus antarcticus]
MSSSAKRTLLRSLIVRRNVALPRHAGQLVRNASEQTSAAVSARTPAYKPFQPTTVPDAKTSGKTRRSAAPIILSTLAAVLGLYITQLSLAASKPHPDPSIRDLSAQTDVAARYNETADNFDSEVGTSEALMGINKVRKRLAGQCNGHVLEVSCGTGRNLGYYDVRLGSKIDSLTFVDLSAPMVEVCKKKWTALYGPTSGIRKKADLVIRFLTGSALEAMPPPPKGEKYDTIIQTMGLCSTAAPTKLLENMAAHLSTTSPDARILLLEHGRSYQDWLNNILDKSAAKHAEIHGCWFNRDIGELVKEAADRSGLEVVKEHRQHLGTTWVYELRFKSAAKMAVPVEAVKEEPANAEAVEETAAQGSFGWRGLFGWK